MTEHARAASGFTVRRASDRMHGTILCHVLRGEGRHGACLAGLLQAHCSLTGVTCRAQPHCHTHLLL